VTPGEAGAAAPPPISPDGRAWVTGATSLRREPAEASRVAGPGGRQVPNALATLQRGEPVTLIEGRDAWARVRTSGDETGWVRRAALLEQEGAAVATVLVPSAVFDRPDLLAANPARTVEPGALLLVVRQRPPFAEVNAGPGPNAWVLADRLVTAERDVSVAKLCEKARWLDRAGRRDEARKVLALGREAYPGAPLLDRLAQDLGEPAAGAVSPAAAPGPPPGQAAAGTPP
jgi:hypothetical protein